VDDLLRSLARGPVPTLAPAESVRRRGDQRRHRARAAVAGVSAVAVLAVGGVAVAVTDEATNRPDSLVPAATPSASPALPPLEAASLPLAGSLLQPGDLTSLFGETWSDPNPYGELRFSTLQVCEEAEQEAVEGINHHLIDGRGKSAFLATLRMASEDQVREVLAAIVRNSARCPSPGEPVRNLSESDPPQNTLTRLADGALGLEQVRTVCSELCQGVPTFWVVVPVDDLIGFARLRAPTDMAPVAARIRARLLDCRGGCPPPERAHPAGFPEEVSPDSGRALWTVLVSYRREDETAAAIEPAAEAVKRLRAAGYSGLQLLLSCQEPVLPAPSWPGPGYVAVQVFFADRAQALAFREAYVSYAGAPLDETAGPYQVEMQCLRG